jgi:hypothetical protein
MTLKHATYSYDPLEPKGAPCKLWLFYLLRRCVSGPLSPVEISSRTSCCKIRSKACNGDFALRRVFFPPQRWRWAKLIPAEPHYSLRLALLAVWAISGAYVRNHRHLYRLRLYKKQLKYLYKSGILIGDLWATLGTKIFL